LIAWSRVSVILGKLMKPVLIPRLFIILILVLVGIIFLAGTMHAFGVADAASTVTPTITPGIEPATDSAITQTPVPSLQSQSGDPTGIIALAIVIVIIVVVATILGGARPPTQRAS